MMRIKKLTIVLLMSCATLTGCEETIVDAHIVQTPIGDIIFPKQTRQEFFWDALLVGTLIEVNGCLLVQTPEDHGNERDVMIWPPGYVLSFRDGNIEVLDSQGKVRARVGDGLIGGGGQTHKLEGRGFVAEHVRKDLEARCFNPYWIVGAGVDLAEQ